MYEALEAEQSVISCLIQRAESVEETYSLLSPEMFDSGLLGRIYFEFRKAFDDHKGLTLIELHQILAADYPDYEIESAFKDCVMQQAMPFQIKGFAEVIQRHYKASSIKAMIDRMELKEADIDDQIDRMIADLEGLRDNNTSEAHTVSEIAEQYKDKYFVPKTKPLATLDIEELDELIGGFEGGDLCIIGARPSVGKSALSIQWAEHFANKGMKVGFYNLEMTDAQMFQRFVASKSGLETTRIRLATRFCNKEEELYRNAVSELSQQNNLYLITGAKKVSDIRTDVRKMRYDIVFVDYLQLLRCSDRYAGNRAAEVGEISRELKAICIDYNICIIALSQLNRASEGRTNREPNMGELREAGNLEQDASVIVLMWQSDENDKSKKGLKVEKSRNGKCGRCDMVFNGAYLRFELEDNESPFGT